MTQAAIYARKSNGDNDRNEDNKSVTRQIERARAYALQHGWIVDDAHIFVDDGVSGAEYQNRPGFARLLNSLADFQYLVMSESSRLGRDMLRNDAYHLGEIIETGIRVFYYLSGEEERLDTPEQKIMVTLKSYASEVEREKASQRSRDALERKALQGCNTGGRVYGYRNMWITEDGRRIPAGPGAKRPEGVIRTEFEIDEEQAEVIRGIYRMRSSGCSDTKIAKTLNGDPRYMDLSTKYFSGQCPPSPRKGPHTWAPSSIHEMLRNERYTGLIPWGEYRKNYKKGTKVRLRQDKFEQVPAPHLQIIADELWRQVQDLNAAAGRTYLAHTNGNPFGRTGPGRESKYLLTGLAHCGCCDANIIAEPRTFGSPGKRKQVKHYGCSGHKNRGVTFCANNHRVRMETANEAVLKAIQEQVLKPEYLAYAVDKALELYREYQRMNPDRSHQIESEMSRLARERDNLVSAIARDGVGDAPETILRQIKSRESRITALKQELEALRTAVPNELDTARLKRALSKRAARFAETLLADVPRARQALRELLVGPLTFRPVVVDGKKTYAFEGRTKVGVLLDPLYLEVASPRGFEPLLSP